MNYSNEDCLRLCGQGDLKQVEGIFGRLNRQEIEAIKDSHQARYSQSP